MMKVPGDKQQLASLPACQPRRKMVLVDFVGGGGAFDKDGDNDRRGKGGVGGGGDARWRRWCGVRGVGGWMARCDDAPRRTSINVWTDGGGRRRRPLFHERIGWVTQRTNVKNFG
ncbi:hypothetical protein Trydic_g5282 [Trypoxylus dichotomus]